MATAEPVFLIRSKHLSYFQQHGQGYAYHNLFGYILGMSGDVVELLEFHRDEVKYQDEVTAAFGDHFSAEQLMEFVNVFRLFSCLVDSQLAEERLVWEMIPVRSRWVVFHQPAEDSLTFWRTNAETQSHSDPQEGWAAKLWSLIDGERSLNALYDEISDRADLAQLDDPRQQVWDTVTRWAHHEQQYIKLAKRPLSSFGPEHQWPSYLRSTMPYTFWDPAEESLSGDPLEPVAVPINPPHAYYEHQVADAEQQFHTVETTLSHLFRLPSPLLNGLSYADQLVGSLVRDGHLGEHTRDILEVGGGMGDVAAGILSRLRSDHPDIFEQVSYVILDLSPALRKAQEKTLAAHNLDSKVVWQKGNVESLDIANESVDLLVCNEVVGDLTTVKLTRSLLGIEDTNDAIEASADWSKTTKKKLGQVGDVICEYGFPFRDAPAEFYFNVGAIQFIGTVAKVLRPGGSAFVSEYGEVAQYPVPSTHLDHIEFSIHFGFLAHAAKHNGLEVVFEYVQDLIGLDRDAQTLATTRTYFASLQAMLAAHDVALDKHAYSREMFVDLLGQNVALEHIGDIRFCPADERCMGLSPHEFKALLLKKPTNSQTE